MAYTYPQLLAFAQNAGFKGDAAYTAAAIGMAESSGNPGAVAVNDGGKGYNSYGLMQINAVNNPTVGNAANAVDPQTSFNMAYQLSNGGSNFSPWSTYNNGMYAQYLNNAASPDASILGGATPGSTDAAGNITNAVAQTDPINSFTGDTTGQTDTGALGDQTTAQDTSGPTNPFTGDTTGQVDTGQLMSDATAPGITFNAKQAANNTEQNATGKSLGIAGIPDVAKALTGAGQTITDGFNAIGETFGTVVSATVSKAENYAGRFGVMLFAIVIFLAGIWFLVPKGRETIVSAVQAAK